MNLDLIDAFGSVIQATFFRESVDKFEDLLKEGKVYLFANANIKVANQKYTNINNPFSLAFESKAII